MNCQRCNEFMDISDEARKLLEKYPGSNICNKCILNMIDDSLNK